MRAPLDGPLRPRRSCLVVPGSNRRMVEKAAGLDIDEVVLDLEDAVAPDHKPGARGDVVAALHDLPWGRTRRTVRINGCGTPWMLADVVTLVRGAGADLDGLVLPKARTVGDVAFLDGLLTHLEIEDGAAPGRTTLTLQLEDAAGVLAIADLLAASTRTDAVTFGPGDLAAALGQPALSIGTSSPDHPGDRWHAIRTSVLLHARAAGAHAIDGPYGAVRDTAGFARAARRSRALGFDGTWVLHPSQVPVANEVYGVSQERFDEALVLLAAYDASVAAGRGATSHGGEMIDEASRRLAQRIVACGEVEGLAPGGTTVRSVEDGA